MSKSPLKEIRIPVQVVNVDRKESSKNKGSFYYIVSYYVDLGNQYPELVNEFSFKEVQAGENTLSLKFISDRNKNLSLQKEFFSLSSPV